MTTAASAAVSEEDAESEEDDKTDYSSSNESVDSDLGFESGFNEIRDAQKYEDDTRVRHKDYKYCISRDENYIPT